MKKYLKIIFETILRLFLIVTPILVLLATKSGKVIYDRVKLDDGTKVNLFKEVPPAIIIGAILMFILAISYVVTSLYIDLRLTNESLRKKSLKTSVYEASFELDKDTEKEYLEEKVKIIRIVNIIFLVIILAFSIYQLTYFSIKQDDRNMYPWAASIAEAITAAVMISVNIYLIKKTRNESEEVGTQNPVKSLAEGAITVAMSVILSVISDLIPGLRLPNGGGVSLSLLPLFIYAFRNGFKKGALAGFVYGLVNFIVDGYVIHWGSIFFDYLIPFTGASLIAGLFSKKIQSSEKLWISYLFVTIAVISGGLFRYLMHSLSGMIFFSEWAPEGMNAAYYSFIYYNLPYMAAVTGATLIFALLLNKRLVYLKYRAV